MTNYYVDSVTGNDNNNGTQNSPWRTIQRAVNDLMPGDIAYLSGRFREYVNLNRNGTPGNYINFEAWPNRPAPIWTAAESINSPWIVHGTLNNKTVWKTTLDNSWILPDRRNLVFWDGMPLSESKYPVNSYLNAFPSFINSTTTNTLSPTSARYNASLPNGLDNTVQINFGGNARWGWQSGDVSSINNNAVTFSYIRTEYGDVLAPSDNDPFYLWGHYNLLQPGQYFLNSNILYLIPPNNSDPNLFKIGIKVKDSLCNPWDNASATWGKHYYKFTGIIFDAAPILLGDASTNWQFYNCRFQYFSYFLACPNGLLSPQYWTDNLVFIGNSLSISDCIFNWFYGGIILAGNDIVFQNNTVSDGNLFGVNQSMVGIGSSSKPSTNIIIKNCTLSRCGRSATGLFNVKDGRILNNEIYDFNRLTNDNGGIYCFGGTTSVTDFGWSEIAYNKVYQENADKYRTGIYLDHGCSKMIVHHNQSTPDITNGNPMRLHSPCSDIKVYNNTFVSHPDKTGNGLSMWGYMGMTGVEIKNNIFTAPIYIGIPGIDNNDLKDIVNSSLTLQRNIYHNTPPLFIDIAAKDYRLLGNSPAADAGLLIPPYTDNYSGFAPDIGALDGIATPITPPVVIPPVIVEPPVIPTPPEPIPVPSPVVPPVVEPSYPPPSPPPVPLPPGILEPVPPPDPPIEPLIPLPPVIPSLPVVTPTPPLPTANKLLENQYKYSNNIGISIRGVSYPLTISNGSLQLSTDIQLIKESIFSVLETRFFERIMRPGYGTPDLIFDAIPSNEFALQQIRMALETQIEDVDFDVTGTMLDSGQMFINIEWTVNEIPQPIIKYLLQK